MVLHGMESGGEATGLCNRLYNFFARHFASQSQRTKLVTAAAREPPWAEGAAVEDFHPVATVPVLGSPEEASAAWGGNIRIGSAAAGGGKAAVNPFIRAASNINERSDEFIRSRKEALQSQSTIRRRSPPRQ